MTDSRAVVLWGDVATHAVSHGRRASVADVCAVACLSAQLDGAWLAAASNGEPDFLMCVTDLVGEQLAELQLTLGEGPGHDVLTSAAPVLVADLEDEEFSRRWPALTPAARGLGAGAVCVFPLIVGAIRAGVLGLYRTSAGPLQDGQLGDLLILADTATVMLLDSGRGPRGNRGRGRAGRAGAGPGAAPHRDRSGHRHADGAARRPGLGGICPAPGLRLYAGPAARGRGR